MKVFKFPTIYIIVLSFLIFQTKTGFSQFHGSPFCPVYNSYKEIDTNKIYFVVNSTSFFKNNEFFSDFEQGYTLPGYSISPKIIIKPYQKLLVEFGAYMLQYNGREKMTDFSPTLRIVYSPSPGMKVVMGNLYGTLFHGLSDFMFDTERYFTENRENGVQLLLNKNKFNSDIWLNWQHFILHGDNQKEQFTFGSSSSYSVLKNSNNEFSLGFRSIITHKGGQIDIAEGSMQTIINSSTGVSYLRNTSENTKLKLSSELLTYADVSPSKQIPYIQGYGIHSEALFSIKNYTFVLGHFYSDRYFSSRGKPIYNTVSNFKLYYEKNRAYVIPKIIFKKDIYKIFAVAADVELFIDLYNNLADYSYGLYFIINTDAYRIKKRETKTIN